MCLFSFSRLFIACGFFRVVLVADDGGLRACPRVGNRVARGGKRPTHKARFGPLNVRTLTGKSI